MIVLAVFERVKAGTSPLAISWQYQELNILPTPNVAI